MLAASLFESYKGLASLGDRSGRGRPLEDCGQRPCRSLNALLVSAEAGVEAWVAEATFPVRLHFAYNGGMSKPNALESTDEFADALERILQRAGFPPTRCQLADLGYHDFAFQPTGSDLSATAQPMLFRQPGILWLRELNSMRFDDSPYRLLGGLCEWAECEASWTDRIWHSAAIECAWSDTLREL